ncbi:DoxX family protein [Microbacterium panaciterrae]|uniref:DoxX family protein n=1 Tax=Microbacterium panaciterrae TaxID=985759 RepID=A0ABP8PGM3_9MICO
MGVIVWIATGLLSVVFVLTGAIKLVRTSEQLAAWGLGWTEDFAPVAVKLIGVAEILGVAGLIIGGLVPVLAWAAPAAAIGLALLMIGAVITHARRREWKNIVLNVALLALAVFVAVARLVG